MTDFQTRIVTKGGRIRFSFVHVFEPHQMEKNGQKIGQPSYSVQILIRKDDTENIELIKAGMAAAFQKGLKEKWNGVRPAELRNPLKDGDLSDHTKRPEHAGHFWMNVTMAAFDKTGAPKPKPVVVNAGLTRITDPVDFYSGCFGNISINFYPYNTLGNGVSAGLQNIQKTADGENLGGGNGNPAADFGDASTAEASNDFF